MLFEKTKINEKEPRYGSFFIKKCIESTVSEANVAPTIDPIFDTIARTESPALVTIYLVGSHSRAGDMAAPIRPNFQMLFKMECNNSNSNKENDLGGTIAD